MRYASMIFPLILLLFVADAARGSGPAPAEPAPMFSGTTTRGDVFHLSDFLGKWVMLEWTNHECPYVRKHYNSGNMQRTQRRLTEDGVIWISIISSAPGKQGYVSADQADTLTANRGAYADMVLLDPEGEIGRAYLAKTTPQMFLIDPEGKVRYMGAIDDKPSARESSLEGATNYVLRAWQAIQMGEQIAPNSTQPYGCSVKYAG